MSVIGYGLPGLAFESGATQSSSNKGDTVVFGSQNLILQAGQVLIHAAEQARQQGRDPARMLRILALLAAPVYDPDHPDRMPVPLDLKQEWHELAQEVRRSQAPILLARLTPPTLEALRAALSPRAELQQTFPHILHFSGHAWKDGLLLEDELGRCHPVTTDELVNALKGLPRPLDLVVLNGCETAAGEARSVAQALIRAGLACAVVGHTARVWDPEAIGFAARLYAELTNGIRLEEALERAKKAVTTHEVLLLGNKTLCFAGLERGEPLIDDRRPSGNLPSRADLFFGRGADLVEIACALAHPPAVVLISGPSGIGKSSLALEVAHRQAWRFPGGVAYARGPDAETGQPVTCQSLLLGLAQGLGLSTTPERVGEDLRMHTALQPTLLVLDNLDGLEAGEAGELADFLRHIGSESVAIATRRIPCAPLERLPTARPCPLHHGIGGQAALHYALELARRRPIPLTLERAIPIVEATGGHPLLIELVVAQAGRRDLEDLLEEVRERKGDFAAQLETVYAWSAERLDEAGRAAWQALLLFPAGAAPERVLWAAASREGVEALREAALADFYPAEQVWRWHASVAEYARAHFPLSGEARQECLLGLLPAWTTWLERLEEKDETERQARLDAVQANFYPLLQTAEGAPRETVLSFLRALDAALPAPDRTLSLRAIQEVLYRTWVGKAENDAERAWALGMLGYALSALGRREEALTATQEAVEIRRQLAQANLQAFLPDLAASINNLGTMLSKLGRREEALKATEEAVELYRELAQANPQAFLPDLAGSLNNLGRDLANLGRWEEALAATQEAVGLYRQLAQANPQAFLPDLAGSLNNLGAMLSVLGRREEALAATEEAVGLHRQLAQANPQAFLPDLAMSLNNLGNVLSTVGRREEALAATQEAVGFYRQLAQAHPQAFLPHLARGLGAHGSVLLALARPAEAVTAFAEGVQIMLPFARALPQAFSGLLKTLLEHYLHACQAARCSPDKALLKEAAETLGNNSA